MRTDMAAAKPTRRAKSSTSGALFFRLKKQVKADYNSKGQVKWRKEAREDFDFDASGQLNEEDNGDPYVKRPIVILTASERRLIA